MRKKTDSSALYKKKGADKAADHLRAVSGQQILSSGPLSNRTSSPINQGETNIRAKKSAYLGPSVPYAEVNSNSTAFMT